MIKSPYLQSKSDDFTAFMETKSGTIDHRTRLKWTHPRQKVIFHMTLQWDDKLLILLWGIKR